MTKETLIEVVSIESGEVVHTVNATKQAAFIEHVEAGLLRNMDTSIYFTRVVTT